MMENEIPQSWISAKLADVISSDGLISDGDWVESKDQDQNGSVRLIQLADIGDGDFRNKSARYMTNERADALNCTFLKTGDVLVARMPDPLGRACIFPGVNQKSVTVVDICVIRSTKNSALSNTLINHWINSPAIRDLIAANASGTTRQRITRKKLEEFELPIPPLAEQKVIAEKLDTLLAQVETTKARLERIPEILKRFRQSVLAAAVSGRLIEQSFTETYSLDDCVDILNGARIPVSSEKRADIKGEYPYFGATGIVDYLNDFTHEGRFLLVGEDGANLLSKTKDLAFIAEGKIWVNNHAHVLKEKEGFNLDFIKISINSLDLTPWVTGSAQPKLTKKSLCELPISKFDFQSQTEIVRRAEQLFTFAENIEQKANSALERVNNLTQSILAKAFKGELTAHWRAANPDLISGENSAEALLKKIKSEREATASNKKAKKNA